MEPYKYNKLLASSFLFMFRCNKYRTLWNRRRLSFDIWVFSSKNMFLIEFLTLCLIFGSFSKIIPMMYIEFWRFLLTASWWNLLFLIFVRLDSPILWSIWNYLVRFLLSHILFHLFSLSRLYSLGCFALCPRPNLSFHRDD